MGGSWGARGCSATTSLRLYLWERTSSSFEARQREGKKLMGNVSQRRGESPSGSGKTWGSEMTSLAWTGVNSVSEDRSVMCGASAAGMRPCVPPAERAAPLRRGDVTKASDGPRGHTRGRWDAQGATEPRRSQRQRSPIHSRSTAMQRPLPVLTRTNEDVASPRPQGPRVC